MVGCILGKPGDPLGDGVVGPRDGRGHQGPAYTAPMPEPAVSPGPSGAGAGGGLPLVSIVTPSFNQGRYIGATIESVLGQDYPNLEYLVHDGGSTDGALEIIESYGDRLSLVAEPDNGQSDALNRGLRRARGDIVAWVNSDDVLLPGAVSAIVERFVAQPELALVYGDGYLIDPEGATVATCLLPEPDLWEMVHLFNQVMLGPAAFFRRDALAEAGYVDERYRWVMDYDLFIKLSLRHPSAHLARPVAAVRVYEDTKSKSGGLARYRELMGMLAPYSTRRLPPATWYFLADTLQANAEGLASDPAAPALGRRLASRVLEPCEAVKRAVFARAHRHYAEGWIESGAELLVRAPRGDALEVEGLVPWELTEGQRLWVSVNGSLATTVELAPGPFTLSVPVPRPGAGRRVPRRQQHPALGATLVRFDAARSWVPAAHGGSEDRRQLAFLLRSIGWAGAPAA